MEPQVKADEEYPLLKVEAGGGDGKIRNPIPTTVMTTGWNITCAPKQSWCTRWPEFVSAFWMTLILLAISFLVFYALGMSAYRRQPIVIVRCNDTNTKPGSDIFYHHIIARNAHIPFTLFSDYLSFMATRYPFLQIHVYFLVDDSWQYTKPRLFKRLVPHISSPFITIFNHKDIFDFQKRYQNVNISVMYLSKYMATTPFRYKWKMIPQNYLTFYARIHELWQNGGIGFDLVTFNNHFNENKVLDHRIDAILMQHNNGFQLDKHDDAIDSLDNEEQNELFSMFFNIMNDIIHEANLFFDKSFKTNVTAIDNSVPNTHRNKGDVSTNAHVFNVTNLNTTANYSNTYINNEKEGYNPTRRNNVTIKVQHNNGSSLNTTVEVIRQHDIILPNISRYRSEIPQVLFFYDISGFSDVNGPTYFVPKPIVQSSESVKKSNYLSLSADGQFVAAASRHHPFLGQLISSGCHRLNPKYAIKDTLFSQCSGFLRDDIYCNNIRIISNLV